MGTLTGSLPSLPEHCPHKLPTSCRLTATALCCACQDKRSHVANYAVYVDGMGMVNRGTRWQRYCYFCMQFWSNRVAATDPPISPEESRVPDVPDQSSFLEKWFDYHRGYKLVLNDGEEKRVEVHCERPWKDCDPGHLPVRSERERMATIRLDRVEVESRTFESIDDTLDDLLEEAGREENGQANVEHSNRMQSDARDTGVQQNLQSAEEGLASALRDLQGRVNAANARLSEAAARREQLSREMEEAENAYRECQREHGYAVREQRRVGRLRNSLRSNEEANARTAQRLARVFGSREEIEQQGADYESPLTSMFTRAYERFRVAEEVRRAERVSDEMSNAHELLITALNGRLAPEVTHVQNRNTGDNLLEAEVQPTLDDENDDRPPPLSDEAMTIKLACRVCLQQRATIAVLPCGHLIFCSWCANICVPTKNDDSTQPVRRTSCPCCRKMVKRRVGIYTV